MKTRQFFLGFIGAVLALFAAIAETSAAEVTAAISSRNPTVGEPIQLEIRCSGGSRVSQAPPVQVDGLDIRYLGPSRQMQFINGVVSHSLTYVYEVVPRRTGSFTIPAIEVEIDGQRAKSAPVPITVGAETNGTVPSMDKIAFAEVTLSKETAYVGEALVAEVRLYVDAAVQSQIETMPQFQGEGFTKTKLTEPRREMARRNEREYNVIVFRSAITPSKAGRISIGPAEFSFIANIPRAQRRQRSLFDMFDDVFSGGGFAAQRRMTATAPAVELTVKPLPVQGRPADFSGAVGTFRFAAEGTPRQVKVGDPVTMRLRLSGQGNFDRMTVPVMTDPAGWRSYPPSDSFTPDDELGTSGTKTFEVAVVPETAKTAMPEFTFSYFDPDAEKYVTLTNAPAPLTVQGAPPPPPPPITAAAPSERAPDDSPAREAGAVDILGLQYDSGVVRNDFAPLHTRRSFLLAQMIPLALVLGLLARRFLRRSNEERARASLIREREALRRKVREETAHTAFYEAAARVIQLETALATGRIAGSVGADDACASRPLDRETREAIEEIFSARAELLYAGHSDGGAATGEVEPAARSRVLATIERFRAAHDQT